MIICLFVHMFVCFCFNHSGRPTENSHKKFVKIRLDLAEILRIRKLDWCDGEGKEKGWEEGGDEPFFVMFE